MSSVLQAWVEARNRVPRRVEGDGHIRWYVDNELVVDVTTDEYYRSGHVHPEGCTCDALVHSVAFQQKLNTLVKR
jgi:hypothetical protein